MPTIKLTDQFGLDLDAQPAPGSALLKYFQQLSSLRFDALDFGKIGGLTLDQPAVRSLRTGVSFQNPVSLGDGAPELSVGAGAHASFEIIADPDDLPGGGDEGLPPDTRYVTFGIDAMASANVPVGAGRVQFGASPATKVEIANYLPLKGGTTLAEAVRQAVIEFAIPVRSSDLAQLQPGQIVRAAVTGTLELSGSVDLLATVNPLASAALPAPLPTVSVSAGGSATLSASCEIEAEYELVARKQATGPVRLEWYHNTGTDATVRAQVSEGISAGIGGTDLFSKVIAAISGNARADLDELQNAGVPEEQAEAIQAAVSAAVSRKLEVAVAAELSAGQSRAATFAFEVVPEALSADSQAALDQALRGDLSRLHAPGLPGISAVRSLWDNVRTRELELDVNLLGILNYRSVASLTLEGKVLYEPATGSLVITDQANAERIQSTQVNFGADTQKLRHVLAESFLITAAYHGARQAGDAALRCSHSFFELQNSTSRGDMLRNLRIGVALGLLAGEEEGAPEGIADFGRTLFTVSTDYDNNLVIRLFLDDAGAPLAPEVYEAAGRNAIQFLVQPGDPDAARLRPAIDDDLWRRMKQAGQPGIAALFPSVAAPVAQAIVADYSAIQWWAGAMQSTGLKLAGMHRWLASNPTATTQDPEFQKLREDLAAHLRDVARNTREEFGEPWGLLAMNQLTARAAGAKLLITGPKLVREKRQALAAATRP